MWPTGGLCVLVCILFFFVPHLHIGMGGENSNSGAIYLPRGTRKRHPCGLNSGASSLSFFLSPAVLLWEQASVTEKQNTRCQQLKLGQKPCVFGQSNQKKRPRVCKNVGAPQREDGCRRGPQLCLNLYSPLARLWAAHLWGRHEET